MPRLQGVYIPNDKKIEYALRYLYGIGPMRAKIIIQQSEIDENLKASDLNEELINRILSVISDNNFQIEGDLRREIANNLKRLQVIQCYRGIRHRKHLPVRGQRTQTNSRTRRREKKVDKTNLRKKN